MHSVNNGRIATTGTATVASVTDQARRSFRFNDRACDAQIGSGAQPMTKIASLAVTLQAKSVKSEDLYQLITMLKTLSQPIIVGWKIINYGWIYAVWRK